MNAILRFLNGKRARNASTQFDRYYLGVLQTGSGYPTADEARKDFRNYHQTFTVNGWPR